MDRIGLKISNGLPIFLLNLKLYSSSILTVSRNDLADLVDNECNSCERLLVVALSESHQ